MTEAALLKDLTEIRQRLMRLELAVMSLIELAVEEGTLPRELGEMWRHQLKQEL